MLPKSLRVTFRLSDSALAIPKSKTLISSSVEHADVSRLEVAVQQQVELSSVECPLERVRSLKELAQLDGHAYRACSRHRPFGDDLGQVSSGQVLHRDEEVPSWVPCS